MRSTLLQTITAVAVVAAAATSLLAPAEAATQEEENAAAALMGEEMKMKRNFHQRFIPHRPDKPSIREQVTERHQNRHHHMKRHLSQLQNTLSDHHSGQRKLSNEEYEKHMNFMSHLQRKLSILENNRENKKDARITQLEIEEEIALHERLLEGEFLWDMERGELVLKEDYQE